LTNILIDICKVILPVRYPLPASWQDTGEHSMPATTRL